MRIGRRARPRPLAKPQRSAAAIPAWPAAALALRSTAVKGRSAADWLTAWHWAAARREPATRSATARSRAQRRLQGQKPRMEGEAPVAAVTGARPFLVAAVGARRASAPAAPKVSAPGAFARRYSEVPVAAAGGPARRGVGSARGGRERLFGWASLFWAQSRFAAASPAPFRARERTLARERE